jgi:hypothetical protein
VAFFATAALLGESGRPDAMPTRRERSFARVRLWWLDLGAVSAAAAALGEV